MNIQVGDKIRYRVPADPRKVGEMTVNTIITDWYGPVEWFTEDVVTDPYNDEYGYVTRNEIIEVIKQ